MQATAATAADVFAHVRIVMGMVIGLGITRLLMGVAGWSSIRSGQNSHCSGRWWVLILFDTRA